MEIYVPAEIANDIIEISKSFNVNAKIIGRVENPKIEGTKSLEISSEFGVFNY